jgi:hypothetical protein
MNECGVISSSKAHFPRVTCFLLTDRLVKAIVQVEAIMVINLSGIATTWCPTFMYKVIYNTPQISLYFFLSKSFQNLPLGCNTK